MCGEHTREILLEVGYSPSEIDTLVEQKGALDAPVERV
jgi:crotonobetainyl-CoA:carnitine CoA-transferase CaiB-like acyl-CoA transferase